jgi:hypothetical protein
MQGGPLTVSYAATPPDVVGLCSDVPALPFADYPMSGPPSYPQFISGFYDPPLTEWYLTFSEPITLQPPIFDPRVWRTRLGPLTKYAQWVRLSVGSIVIGSPTFSPLDDTVVYTGGPPDWADAEGDPVQAFSHALPA